MDSPAYLFNHLVGSLGILTQRLLRHAQAATSKLRRRSLTDHIPNYQALKIVPRYHFKRSYSKPNKLDSSSVQVFRIEWPPRIIAHTYERNLERYAEHSQTTKPLSNPIPLRKHDEHTQPASIESPQHASLSVRSDACMAIVLSSVLQHASPRNRIFG